MHQISAPKFLLLSLKSFFAEKKHWAMQKLFIKKEEKRKKRDDKKYRQVSEISKIMGTEMPAWEKKEWWIR